MRSPDVSNDSRAVGALGPRRRRRRWLLALAALTAVVTAIGTVVAIREAREPGCVGDVGLNWPAAGRVYLAGLSERSTRAEEPDRALAVTAAAGVRQVRVLVGVDAAIATWTEDPERAAAGLERLLDDANERGLTLVLSQYPDLPMISALAGHDYPSWAAAQRDLTTPGSVPYQRFETWLRTMVSRFATHPAAAAWEVVSEPGYMLGIDSGAVTPEAALTFVSQFAALLQELGARNVTGGGRPVYDPTELSDATLAAYVRHLDVLDDHLYPPVNAGTGEPAGTAGDGRAAVEQAARWFDRARAVAGRPDMPAMLGEVGTQPGPWFDEVLSAATERGWPVLAWGYDAWDANEFNDQLNPQTLQILTGAAAHAEQTNGAFAVAVGSPACRA